jgi:hypothetical protein
MPDMRDLVILAVLILVGLGVTNLVGAMLEQRAVIQAEAPLN